MPYVDVVCLANSRKHGGRCVAGLRTDGSGWVRPVAPSDDGTLYERHYTLGDGTEARVLDLLRIDVASPCPKPHQPENWTMGRRLWIFGRRPWKLMARPAGEGIISVLRSHLELGPDLFGDQSDRIAYNTFLNVPAPSSLTLVAPPEVSWVATTGYRGNRQIRAEFNLGKAHYSLVVTDPLWEGRYPFHSPDTGVREKFLLTISLSEPFKDYCYKLVAGVIRIPSIWRAYL